MFIEIQDTPNPKTLKFVLSEPILQGTNTHHFNSKDEAVNSPLAVKLFKVDGVSAVFLGHSFVSVSVEHENNWLLAKPKLLAYINEFIESGIPVVRESLETKDPKSEPSTDIENSDAVEKIIMLFEERIRPAVAMDGGDIVFRDFKDGIVYISMHGACQGCPASDVTLKNGIENMLMYYIPEVQSVVNIDEEAS